MRYVQLPATFFTTNRERLVAMIPEKSLVVLNANDIMPTNADGSMGFMQNSDLYYLSGVDQEDTILLLFPGASDPKRREVLFVRETNEYLATWEGAKLSKEEGRAVSGIETVLWLSDFDRVFRDLMFEAETLYLNSNEHVRAGNPVQTRDSRFIETVRNQYPLHRLARIAPMIYRMRMIKSPEEVEALREATRSTEAGFRRVLQFVKPGVTEYDVEAELSHEYIKRRSRGFSYPPIIASGLNACVLHYLENNATCEDGEMLLMDVAAEYAYYHSDMTRTIPVNGKFTPRQRQVYEAVLRVLRACSKMLRPGVIPSEYQEEVNKIMEAEIIGLGLIDPEEVAKQDPDKPLYKKYFMHGVSHQIGLDVHDVYDPTLPYAEGMVLTVEPGIYIREEKLAVRLENLILIGRDDNEDLMEGVPLEADEIEALMQQQ
ncbi:M24 family metallopeptidase [bacterium]|nr:MAG: M24 family metallopeptidase [bacterium]